MSRSALAMPDPDDAFHQLTEVFFRAPAPSTNSPFQFRFSSSWPNEPASQSRLPGTWPNEPASCPSSAAAIWTRSGTELFCPSCGTSFNFD